MNSLLKKNHSPSTINLWFARIFDLSLLAQTPTHQECFRATSCLFEYRLYHF